MQYQIGQEVIMGEEGKEGWIQCFAIGQRVRIANKYNYDLYELQDSNGVRCTMHKSNFRPAGRIPTSDGCEGETAYCFPVTDQSI